MPLPCLWQVGVGEVRSVTSGKACQIAALALGGGAGVGQLTRTQGCKWGSAMSACFSDRGASLVSGISEVQAALSVCTPLE